MSIYSKIDLKGADGEVYDGSVANRFERDYENMAVVDTAGNDDNRKGRQLDEQSIERQGRLYVDRETLVSATGQDAQVEEPTDPEDPEEPEEPTDPEDPEDPETP